MGDRMRRFFQFLGFGDEEWVEEPREEEIPGPAPGPGKKGAVVSLHQAKSVKLVLCEPARFEEGQGIADHLRNRRAAVINLQKVPYEEGLRIMDFLSGVLYALGGTMQKIGPQIILCAPDNVDVQGAISEYLSGQESQDKTR
ncbi:cell division protein SepF [Kyrpidia spormannii]|uniref:Cell division protein SepF n=1 Tax=Kyrpidia spormannii TaxID=2055160 RepID=A0A2K8N5V0_9BACL|nr:MULTISPECIES: cell division protein SepF [Kyrpidia]ATY84739.1 cell division protein SepF [Kyrpidia spormannii]MCL6575493.1 cell division protein SepF [Kyrpidia sp.]CAB3392739.1 cell division machinery factor [Kyrpidia spormannii]HHY66061.1 cell division protein SepF [Alicyclobacillus sp.]